MSERQQPDEPNLNYPSPADAERRAALTKIAQAAALVPTIAVLLAPKEGRADGTASPGGGVGPGGF